MSCLSDSFCFPIDEFTDRRTSMHCSTVEEANAFLEFLHMSGRRWRSGSTYLSSNNFESHGSDTCYFFNEGTYGGLHRALDRGEVLEFSDFVVSELEQDDTILNEFLSSFDTK